MKRLSCLIAILWVVAGCNKGTDSAAVAPEATKPAATTSETTGSTATTEPAKTPPETTPPAPSGKVKIVDTKVGTGKQSLADGDMAYVIYTGKLTDGTQFDSNDKEGGEPFTVVLGSHGVIEGWEQGLIGMKKGGVRKLTIPPDLAYGKDGRPGIPPNATLVFDIKLLDLVKKGEENVWEKTIKKQGKGEGAKKGDKVTVHYTGWLVNGRKFDSSRDSGTPFEFELGAGRVIPGWDAGLVGMKRGEIRNLWIAPGIAYGPSGRDGIPANSILIFEIEMLKINGK